MNDDEAMLFALKRFQTDELDGAGDGTCHHSERIGFPFSLSRSAINVHFHNSWQWQCVKERKKEAMAIPILRAEIILHSQPLLHSSISGGIDETAKKKERLLLPCSSSSTYELNPAIRPVLFLKVDRGGEDALLVSNYNGGVLAIADGVSGWAEEDVDPSLFPHELMAVQRIAIGSPREVAQPDAIRAAFAEFFSTLIFVFAAEGSDMSYNNLTQALLFLSHFMGDIHQSFFTFYALVVERFGQRIGLFCLFALIFPAFLCVVYERWLQKLYCMIFQLTLPLAIPVIAFMHSSKHTHSRYWFLAIDEEQSPKNLKLLSYFAHANWQLEEAAVEESNGNKDAMDLEIRSRGNVVEKLVRTKHHKEITFPLVINSSESKPIRFKKNSCTYG
ncbi:hypothetical protein Ahy_B03g064375 isoform A [Arachis hypogaea]|uniref:Uncharacterized protein n=1 Tax=Arachis hypogaea TaxID=3818 RepID=A0A444ZZF9_ARAHY|nr:hypothetical protein Ahy_B03g064375 isoform A [Arachis hypogaea]